MKYSISRHIGLVVIVFIALYSIPGAGWKHKHFSNLIGEYDDPHNLPLFPTENELANQLN